MKKRELEAGGQNRTVASYMDLDVLPEPRNLYEVVTNRRYRNRNRTITRVFFAALVKEGFSQEAEKHLVNWMEEKEREANRFKDEHRMQEAERDRKKGGMDDFDKNSFVPDVGFTGFTLVTGQCIVCLLESSLS